MKKNIFVFGSTGSIGIQTLDVLSNSNIYNVAGLSCNSNSNLLFDQVKFFHFKGLNDSSFTRFIKLYNILNVRFFLEFFSNSV